MTSIENRPVSVGLPPVELSFRPVASALAGSVSVGLAEVELGNPFFVVTPGADGKPEIFPPIELESPSGLLPAK